MVAADHPVLPTRRPREGLTVIVGLALDGAALTETLDLAPRQALIGRITLGPLALLRDLELRLGLVGNEIAPAVRGARWSTRVARVAAQRFYAQSHEVDPWGTALELLRWRDELVLAGWNGGAIDAGSERLTALAELEAMREPSIPPSDGDRLIAIERALATTPTRIYERIRLVDPLALWPRRWRDVFSRLAAAGCSLDPYAITPQLAPPSSDLGRMQRHDFTQPVKLTGDGTIVILRAETPWEAAHAAAALLRSLSGEASVVIRGRDSAPLDAALMRQGLASQGVRTTTRARPILQLLPLAIELSFEPKDPFRILELLLLHHGPFDGAVGRRLARALAERPGLGPTWRAAKTEAASAIRERHHTRAESEGGDLAVAAREADAEIASRLGLVDEWIEQPGSPVEGAPRSELQRVAARVRAWLATSYALRPDDTLTAIALAHANALVDSLADDPRERIDLVQTRQILQTVIGHGCTLEIAAESAGRIDHVDEPAALLCARDTVVWWRCVEADVPMARWPSWSRPELEALARQDVAIVDPREQLASAAAGWRRALLSARQRLILVQPRAVDGVLQDAHPFVDELAARTDDPLHGLDAITLDVSELLAGQTRLPLPALQLRSLEPLPLPAPRPTWHIDPPLLTPPAELSATGVEKLIGCPLRFVLGHHAGLQASRATAIPTESLLYGALGHRLVEELHRAHELHLPLEKLETDARTRLATLVAEEGAPLLLPGMQSELAQLESKLLAAVRSLAQLLDRARLTIVTVEHERETEWNGRRLFGRTDLLLRRDDGGEAIVDLKWGRSTYTKMLVKGRALQLATYGFIGQRSSGGPIFPPVAYFSLSRGTLLTTEPSAFSGARPVTGKSAQETWRRADATLARIEGLLKTGAIPVAGVGDELPIVVCAGGTIDAPDAMHIEPEHACEHCDHDALCGRRWESA